MVQYLQDIYVPARLELTRGSVDQLRVAVSRFSAWLGRPAALADLKADVVVAWLRSQQEKMSPATVNSRRAAILAIWNDAADHGLVAPPPRRLPRVRVPARVPEALTVAELERLVAACRRVPGLWDGCPAALCWHLGIMIIWDTACRLGSLLAARVVDVDLGKGAWFVPAAAIKGRRADRLFQLHAQTVGLVRESVTDWPPRERLFPFPWKQRQVWRHFAKILQNAGLPSDRRHKFHCLRRSAESHAAAVRGVAWAAERVGHSEQVAKKHYISPAIVPQESLCDVLPRPVV